MVFSSIFFLLYFLPILLLLYYCTPSKYRNITALLGSIFFYTWGAPEFFILLIASLIVDFYLARMTILAVGQLKKRLYYLSILFSLGLLLLAKYLNFFVENINVFIHLLGNEGIKMNAIILPIGISFVTFQRISYLMDCYSGRTKPLERFQDYALYILLFPQLIAGPIVRFNEISAQILDRRDQYTIDNCINGFFRFIIGLSKKVLIANTLGVAVDYIFGLPPGLLNSTTAWVGIIAYSFQIYFDFSGYSDMAIGLGQMLGFRFPENFNFPYISKNITEFWRRWHITLGNWMRDYLYIPLGGNRVSTSRLYFNLWIVFLLSGLWHGAAWTFIFWGAFHGFFLILDRLFLIRCLDKLGAIPSITLTYFFVLIGWIFFRVDDMTAAWYYISSLFAFDFSKIIYFTGNKFWMVLAFAFLFSFAGFFPKWRKKANEILMGSNQNFALTLKVLISILLGIGCQAEIMASGFNPFIYFRF